MPVFIQIVYIVITYIFLLLTLYGTNGTKVCTKSLVIRRFFPYNFLNSYSFFIILFLFDRGQKALCYIWKEKKENLSLRRNNRRSKNPTSAILSVWPPNSHCTYLYHWERTCQNFVLVDKPERQIWAVFWGRFYAHKPPWIKGLFTFLYLIYDTLYSSFKITLPISKSVLYLPVLYKSIIRDYRYCNADVNDVVKSCR